MINNKDEIIEKKQLKLTKQYSIEQEKINNSEDKLYTQTIQHEQEMQKLQNQALNQRKKSQQKQFQYDYSDSDQCDSEEERMKIQEERREDQIRKKNLNLKAQKKIFVGSGFTFDMTDFFKFKKKQLSSDGKNKTFFQQISGTRVAWLILLYTVCTTAMIPGWIMNIKATKFIRKVWRFFMQGFIVLPFVLYQKRTIPQQNKQKYTLKYILNPKNIIKPYMSSLSQSLWFLCILSSFQWTYVSHGIVLGSLANFFLSIGRSIKGNSHNVESGGQVLVVIGIILVFIDSFKLDVSRVDPVDYNYINTFYLYRQWWQRITFDCVAIFCSFMTSQFMKYTSDLRNYYPPFLSMLIINIFNVFNLLFIAFFFNGVTFDFDSFWGVFSIFTDYHFNTFMFFAIVLALGQMVSIFMVSKMFPDPIIPALALTLQPFIASFFVYLGNVQSLPDKVSMVGYLFIFPGMMLVIMGQCLYQRQQQTQLEDNKKIKSLQEEIKALKQITKQRQAIAQNRRTKITHFSKG